MSTPLTEAKEIIETCNRNFDLALEVAKNLVKEAHEERSHFGRTTINHYEAILDIVRHEQLLDELDLND